MKKEYKFTTSLYPPLHLATKETTQIYPTPSDPHPPTNDPVFSHAMHVRDAVFVQEQRCRAEEEIDDDDARSWGWVVYAHPTPPNHQEDGEEGTEGGQAVGTIRLVPPPHVSHSHLTNPTNSTASDVPSGEEGAREYDYSHEAYIKITRVAVLPAFRGYGVSRLLMRTVEDWARQNKAVIDQMYSLVAAADRKEERTKEGWWNGLIGLHAQVQVERMYASMGYETDDSMGRWDEEGIEHVGMFKRVDVV
ncbi:uncharacterized protein BHQ10_003738 [Talaromyces amestolkiae]|uniref:N-acetyltransferase domain-containing protein n=1 Tax=Talaromyces amestolkiae TaxID=1196081 RepID=A0A364KVZ2_TALAM|nr:uncharacterized protein BHQ10_003738 [Talaromyces amestolkiae]RAO67726.1 hypothetical protein BHQ10_003738 [Talaromyces amestolkiae]